MDLTTCVLSAKRYPSRAIHCDTCKDCSRIMDLSVVHQKRQRRLINTQSPFSIVGEECLEQLQSKQLCIDCGEKAD